MSCFPLLSTSSTRGLKFLPSATRIVSVGSSKIHLQLVAQSIFRFCISRGIALEAQWIPRSLNERADLLSQFADKDDWRVNPSGFDL